MSTSHPTICLTPSPSSPSILLKTSVHVQPIWYFCIFLILCLFIRLTTIFYFPISHFSCMSWLICSFFFLYEFFSSLSIFVSSASIFSPATYLECSWQSTSWMACCMFVLFSPACLKVALSIMRSCTTDLWNMVLLHELLLHIRSSKSQKQARQTPLPWAKLTCFHFIPLNALHEFKKHLVRRDGGEAFFCKQESYLKLLFGYSAIGRTFHAVDVIFLFWLKAFTELPNSTILYLWNWVLCNFSLLWQPFKTFGKRCIWPVVLLRTSYSNAIRLWVRRVYSKFLCTALWGSWVLLQVVVVTH